MPSADITTGVAAIDSLDGVTVIEGPYQTEEDRKWTVEIELQPTTLPERSSIPAASTWYVRLAPTYPDGEIRIYPAKEGGITATYPHQRLNVAGDEQTPWRKGNICVARYGHILGRSGATGEPTTATDRLRWHIERALVWIEAAAKGELRREGEPYELPVFDTPTAGNRRLAYNETRESFEQWTSEFGSWGRVDLAQLDYLDDVVLTAQFSDQEGNPVHRQEWGDSVTRASQEPVQGAWMLLEEPPIEPPWEIPETWGDLADLLGDIPHDLYELRVEIEEIVASEPFRCLLIGFPIPEEVGGPSAYIHWQPIGLSALSTPSDVAGGFRETSRGQRAAARVDLAREPIQWLEADNWAHSQLSRRGRVSPSLTEANVVLLGAGALGSTVAECLVRDGCRHITVVDGEDFEVGNLARHTLALPDVGENKADALIRRLRSLSPHVKAESVANSFPPNGPSPEWVEHADVVIDCTASNAVLHALDSTHLDDPVLFCSGSMGRRGNRLFYFSAYSTSFPYEQFREEYDPWRIQEQVEWQTGEDAVPERVGCWHPASVIRMDRVMMWAGSITRLLDADTSLGLGGTEFRVLETGTGTETEPGTVSDEPGLPLISETTNPSEDIDTWVAPDSGGAVELPRTCLDAMIDLCTGANPLETGGILAGTIRDETTARVVRASDPPRDSTQGPTTFHRGTEGVDEWLREARDSMGLLYLGEWHYHPSAPPQLGAQDRAEMNEIASNEDYGRPNPILFIIGGDPPDDYSVRAYLFHRDRPHEELARVQPSDQSADDIDAQQSTIDFPRTTVGDHS
jgi:hypothetical protein